MLPQSEVELAEAGEWIRGTVLQAGAMPETAYKVAAEWVTELRRLMEDCVEDWAFDC